MAKPSSCKIDAIPNLRHALSVKTTIDIPEPLYHEAKIRAAECGESLGELVIKSLEHILNVPKIPAPSPCIDAPLFTLDEFGFPVLAGRDGVHVTEELINRIREEEGI
jgi:hypothetical protein